jgi:hypothetical protein
MMNPGPPPPRTLRQARSGERPWPGEPAWHAQVPRLRDGGPGDVRPTDREPTLVIEVDLRAPLPDIAGGVVTRVWLMLRIGRAAVGDLLIPVPASGLRGDQVGAAIAARIGAKRRGALVRPRDGQPRSRRRGSTSSL